MPPKLRLTLDRPTADLWEQWAHKHQPWETEPDRPVQIRDGLRLPIGKYGRLWLPTGEIILPPVRGGARLFDDAASDYLTVASAVVTAYPFTMAAWFRSNDATIGQGIFSIGDTAAANDSWTLQASGATGGDPVNLISRAGGTSVLASTTTGYSANVWHHIGGKGASATSRDCFIDGGSKGSNSTNSTPTGLDATRIGVTASSTLFRPFSGDIAECAIWDAAHADADFALLAKAVSALMVHPESLVFYVPLIGRFSPEIDIIGGLNLTVTGAVASAHPRIFYIPWSTRRLTAPSGGDGTDMPWPSSATPLLTSIPMVPVGSY